MRFSTATIKSLKLDTGVVDKIVFDDDVTGFGIRVRASGARTWIFQYKIGGRTRRLVLGRVSAIKLAKARDIAGELHAKVRLGGDPASEKREKVQRALDTFGSLVDLFLGQYRANDRSGVSDWVIHDIRRTVATGMADIGIPPHIIEAVLNHVSGHKGGVAGIYNRSSYAAEKAAALARWDEHVASIVGARDAQV
jgi:hypothetical protein